MVELLKRYSLHLLEYTYSIGMRRLLADAPMIAGYTIRAGVWKLAEGMNRNQSQLHLLKHCLKMNLG